MHAYAHGGRNGLAGPALAVISPLPSSLICMLSTRSKDHAVGGLAGIRV